MKDFSEFIVYVDESGDHSLASIDKDYPIFVLAFTIFKKDSYIKVHQEEGKSSHIVVEKRGHKEDMELELEFRRICSERNYSFDIILADKKTNSTGLQLSDMVARPIGRNFINPNETNRAYEIIKTKLYKAKKPQPKVEA